jgi:colanic acid/amylovoran biosynthesis glycosyltransferase
MKVAYLVNRYPSNSHTFIRREIQALEALGIPVERFSLRPVSKGELADADDHAELERTRAVLAVGKLGLFAGLARTILTRPARFVAALRLAIRVAHRSDRGLFNHLAYLIEACVLLPWLRRSGCDHVHAHFGTNSAAVAMFCRELGGPPYSYTMHHGAKEILCTGGVGPAEKIMRSRFVSVVSSFGRSEVWNCTDPGYWSKAHLVRCGLDAPFLEMPVTPVPAEPRLVCVARISAQKGQVVLVEAAAKLKSEGVPFQLVFVGDGEMRSVLEASIAEHQLGDRVRITGWADGAAVRREILAARAFVLPSFSEGLPVAIMEAFALGRPVVSTYVAGVPELVEPGHSGWLVPAGAVEELVTALREVLAKSPTELTAMAAAGRRRVHEQHDCLKNAAILRDLFLAGGSS